MQNLKRLLDDPHPVVTKISDYQHLAEEVIRLSIVREARDMNFNTEGSNCFSPTFVHQIFGEEGQIYGYTDLKIEIFFSACTLRAYIRAQYASKTEDADDFMLAFDQVFYGGYTTDYKEFLDTLRQEQHYEPIGDIVKNFICGDDERRTPSLLQFNYSAVLRQREDQGDEFRICRSHHASDGFSEHRKRVFPLMLFTIETASFDTENEWPWVYYSLYKRGRSTEGKWLLLSVVSVTIFCFSVTAERWRISQMLTLPPQQRRGYAQVLLFNVYNDILAREPKCLQISVEDPNDDFQVVRDVVETKLALERDLFKVLFENEKNGVSKDKSEEDAAPTVRLHSTQVSNLTEFQKLASKEEAILANIQQQLKLPRFQALRILDVVLLSRLNLLSAEVYEAYKKRWITRIKNQELPSYKRKVPLLVFEGEAERIDVSMITEMQNKALQQDKYYDRLFEDTLAVYKVIMQKCGLLDMH